MGCEISKGIFCHIRTMVNIALCHYFIYGFFVVCFVYTNSCYPPFYYVDHMFGGSGAFLMGITIIGSMFAHLNSCQPVRLIFGIIIPLNVLILAASTFYYTIERWHDVEVTAIRRAVRSPETADFPDMVWQALTVLCCINCILYLIYLPYLMSFFCHQRKLYLFSNSRRPIQLNVSNPFYAQTAASVGFIGFG